MADLSPNLSLYQHVVPQGGIGSLDLGGLLNITRAARELQTQQAVSDQLKASGGDPNAALTGLLQPGSPGFVNPETVAQLSRLGQYYTEQSTKAVGALYTKAISRQGANSDDFANTASLLAGLHVPPQTIMELKRQAERPDGSLDGSALLRFWNFAHPESPLPTIGIQTPSGVSGQIPAATAQFNAGPGGFVPQTIPGATTPPEASGKALAQARDASSAYSQETYPLRATIHALEQLPEQGTGEGTEAVNKIKNFLTVIGADKTLGIDPNTVTNYEQAKKYMIQWANSVSAAGTNDRLSAAIAGNPNMTLLKSTNLTIAKTALALRRIQQVQLDEFDRTGMDPGQFQRWSAQWNKTQDPRAYAFDLMGRDNAAKLLKSMTPQERTRFEASLNAARRSGLAEGNL